MDPYFTKINADTKKETNPLCIGEMFVLYISLRSLRFSIIYGYLYGENRHPFPKNANI